MAAAESPVITQNALINLHKASLRAEGERHAIYTPLMRYAGDGGIITEEQAKAIAAAEGQLALERFLFSRLEGIGNDSESREDALGGVTALVCDNVVDTARDILGEEAFSLMSTDLTVVATDLTEAIPFPREQRLHFIRFPQGFFREQGVIAFYRDRESFDRNKSVHAANDSTFINAGKGVVSRIEGDAGEFWQNRGDMFHDLGENPLKISIPTPFM